MSTVQYAYALNSSGDVVHINQAHDRSDYYKCIDCKNILIPKRGEVKSWHFAHKSTVLCSGETYLHKLGKQVFYEEFSKCIAQKLPFFIELPTQKECTHYKEIGASCITGLTFPRYDFTKYFDKIELEKHDDGFIPDLKLTSKGSTVKVYVEIAVTHKVTTIKRDSGHRIIEIELSGEKDVQMIKGHCITNRKNIKVSTFNFKSDSQSKDFCAGQCNEKFHFLHVDQDGSCGVVHNIALPIISKFIKSEDIQYHKILPVSKHKYDTLSRISKHLIATALDNGIEAKDCGLCKYHGDNTEYSHPGNGTNQYVSQGNRWVFCKWKRDDVCSNSAVNCQAYRPHSEYINKYLNILK